jgi:hypothetical protein
MNVGFVGFQAFAGLESPPQQLILNLAWLRCIGSGAGLNSPTHFRQAL